MYTVIVRSGNKFPYDYVKAWRKMVPDVVIVGEDWPFMYNWGGWFSLYEMFSPEFPYRPCLYFDLDTFILGDISEFYEVPSELMMITDFYNPHRENSGVMQIPENVDTIWNVVNRLGNNSDPPGNVFNSLPHGNLSKKYPDKIVSYKAHNCKHQRPDAPIMCFHGKPKPHTLPDGWANDLWQTLII